MAMTFFSRLDLQEGLQTLAVMHWIPLYVVLGAIPIFLVPFFLVFTRFWSLSLLTIAWLFYDWNTHLQGGRRSAWVRNWTLWKYFRNYFPIKLVKTHDLSPQNNYIIGNHPHGVLSFGAFINFATEATGFSQIFPSITPYLGTLEGIFWIPLVREYVMSMGICPVSKSALEFLMLRKGSGNAVVVMVGGAAEALLCHPGANTVILKKRKGFVRLALKTGAHLVPSYSFGENDAFNQETFPEGTWLRFFQNAYQKTFKKLLGLNLCTFHGRGLTHGSWGFLPFKQPITTVGGTEFNSCHMNNLIYAYFFSSLLRLLLLFAEWGKSVGEPLPIPKILRPTQETVDKYHALYINALRKLFDQHKVKYGLLETQELMII